MTGRALVTGATGFIGGRLAHALQHDGWNVRGLVRDRSNARARDLARSGISLHEGDVLRPETLRGAGRDIDAAYHLIHSMGRGASGDFVASELAAATAFARMPRAEGVERVIYLGGLGDRPKSKHLRSRHQTALALAEHGPPLTYFRAGMVVGAQSESYRTLRFLVQRLPAMIAPAWLQNATQPIGIDDTLSYLLQAPSISDSTGREVQIGGARRPFLRRNARPDGDRARPAPAAADPGTTDHAVALVALDRTGHSGRRGRRTSAGRGARRPNGRRGLVRREALRHGSIHTASPSSPASLVMAAPDVWLAALGTAAVPPAGDAGDGTRLHLASASAGK